MVVEFEHRIAALRLADPDLDYMRGLILSHAINDPDHLRDHVEAAMGPSPLEKLLSQAHVAICPSIRRAGDMEVARLTMVEELAKLDAQAGLNAEIAEAAEDMVDGPDETMSWRLRDAAEAANRARRSQQEDKAIYETAKNGLQIDRAERAALDQLIARIRGDKPPS